MSKRVKDLVTRDLADRFKDLDGVAVINPRGMNATKNNMLRRRLHEKGLRMTVVKNTLARRAVGDGSKLKGFDQLLEGPSAVIYGKASIASVARLVLDEKKADETIEVRGIFFDGEAYVGDKGVEQVSKLPTREEAIGLIASALLGPGRKLAAALKGPGGTLGAILKTIEERATKAGGPDTGAAPAAEAPPAPGGSEAPPASGSPETPPATST